MSSLVRLSAIQNASRRFGFVTSLEINPTRYRLSKSVSLDHSASAGLLHRAGSERFRRTRQKQQSTCGSRLFCEVSSVAPLLRLGEQGRLTEFCFLRFRWCNPCRKLTPRLESIIAERKGKVILAKVDIDENADLALCYEVSQFSKNYFLIVVRKSLFLIQQ